MVCSLLDFALTGLFVLLLHCGNKTKGDTKDRMTNVT